MIVIIILITIVIVTVLNVIVLTIVLTIVLFSVVVVFVIVVVPCLPLRFASDASASAEAGGVRWHPLSSSFLYSSFCHYHYLWSSYFI